MKTDRRLHGCIGNLMNDGAHGSLVASIWGLTFALGLLHGRSQADVARELNCSRALISRYKKVWEKRLSEEIL